MSNDDDKPLKPRAGEAYKAAVEAEGGSVEAIGEKLKAKIPRVAATWTQKALRRWREAADLSWTVIDGERNPEAVEFTAFPSWGRGSLLDGLDQLTELLGGLLARRGIDPDPFYRAVERVRTFAVTEDNDAQALAVASLRSGLDFADALAERIGSEPQTEAEPPKPAPRKRGRRKQPSTADRNARILELHEAGGMSPKQIAKKVYEEMYRPKVSSRSITSLASRARAERDKMRQK